uniref:Holliday junction resolvase n=1 Tax=viral metagenome TaxID=1070528 RepID=A0A6M3JYA2_9ZZZZ
MVDREKTRAYGAELQRKAKAILEEWGYCVHNQTTLAHKIKNKEGREFWVSKRNDIFGCIDLVAIHPEKDNILFIQVTAHTGVGMKLKELAKVPWNKACRVELWLYKGQGRWVLKELRRGIRGGAKLGDYAEIQRGKLMLIGEGGLP